jgi:hypothetical protein
MQINVLMTVEEFDRYRAYLKEKSSLEQEISEAYDGIREKHEKLCDLICKGINEAEETLHADFKVAVKFKDFVINDKEALSSAIAIAADWFC